MSLLLGWPDRSQAELILDNFDDPVELVSPAMYEMPVTTLHVGPLDAMRTLEIDGSSSINPTASFDANVTNPSQLSASLTALNRLNNLSAIIGFEFNYSFSSTDISQGGANDAILFDLHSINGSRLPTFLRAIVLDGSNFYESLITSLPLNSGPFTVEMPFSSFAVRGGAPGLPDLRTIEQINFDFFFLGGNDPVQWSMQMDRIRIGRIPEASTGALAVIGTAIAGCVRDVRRRPSFRRSK